MAKKKRPTPMKEFLDNFFDLWREYQQEIPPHKMAEVLREYADRLDGWTKTCNFPFLEFKNKQCPWR